MNGKVVLLLIILVVGFAYNYLDIQYKAYEKTGEWLNMVDSYKVVSEVK